MNTKDIKRIRQLKYQTGGQGLNTQIIHLNKDTFTCFLAEELQIFLAKCTITYPSNIIIVDIEKNKHNIITGLTFYLENFLPEQHVEIFKTLKSWHKYVELIEKYKRLCIKVSL